MEALLSAMQCSCSRPLQIRQRSYAGFSSPLPALHGVRSSSAQAPGVCHMKKDTHPEFFEEAKVFCNGEEVMTTSGTQEKYTVDIWSGNHPFFKGSSSTVVVDEGRVNRFKRRYAGLDTMADMSSMKQGGNNEVDLTAFKNRNKGKKGKGKK